MQPTFYQSVRTYDIPDLNEILPSKSGRSIDVMFVRPYLINAMVKMYVIACERGNSRDAWSAVDILLRSQFSRVRPAPVRNTWYQRGPVENANIASHIHDKYYLLLRLCRSFCGCPQCGAAPYRDCFLDLRLFNRTGAWGSATAAKRGPLKQSWAGIQHSRDDEPLGVLMQMRNVRVNGFFLFSSLGVLPGVLVDTLSLCSGNFCVECVLIVLHKFYIELYKKYSWLNPGPSMRFDEIIILFCNKCR